jgi:hypothetical protein
MHTKNDKIRKRFVERRIDRREVLLPLDRELVSMVREKRGAKARRAPEQTSDLPSVFQPLTDTSAEPRT